MPPPPKPKIYHIVHVDRLPSIIADGYLWCDRVAIQRGVPGTTIGMSNIKERRLNQLTLNSYPSLNVGDCVPFYFCPRSVMLYVIHRSNNPDLSYEDGQAPIVHLEADLHDVVNWANDNNRSWAFTTSNAGSYYFDDHSDLDHLDEINWNAVAANQWSGDKESKQSEFLVEHSFPWHLVSRVGVLSNLVRSQVVASISTSTHQPVVQRMPGWYY